MTRPLVTPEAMAGWWGVAPEARVGGAREGLTAALWRFDWDDTTELASELDPATHIVHLTLEGRSRNLFSADGRLRYDHLNPPGACTLVRAGERPHCVVYDPRATFLHFYLPDAVVRRCLAEAAPGGTPGSLELIDPMLALDPEIERIGRAVVAEMRQPGPAARVLVDSLALALAVHLIRRWSNLAGKPEPAGGGLAPWRLRRVLDCLEDRLADDLSLAQVAAAAGLSPHHLARAFRRATGRTLFGELQHRRIGRARELLARTDLPLVEIALACGFKGQSHFGQAFRRATGATPGAYRRGRRS